MTQFDPKQDILARYHTLVQLWNENVAAIAQLNQAQTQLAVKAQDFTAAARIFGFDLDSEYREWAAQIAAISATPYVVPPAPSAPAQRNRKIRDLVLEAAKRAYPDSVRAADVRAGLEAQGISIHEKTVGMTLYRLSREGSIQRIGRADWFFVPEDQRWRPAVVGGEESPGDEPGLLLEAEQ